MNRAYGWYANLQKHRLLRTTMFWLPCQSHASFQRFMTPPERIRVAKNTGSANDFAHFEQIHKMQPKNIITMSTNRWQNYPWRRITLQA